mmetsp:Transcript_80098/g.214457  ORF Transcript_80098/g.214457 Transcript_80098/m.214457 type:complete len:282 (-) Transcript_80098:2689-3534(-)
MSGSLPNLGYCAPRMMASSLTAPRASDEVGRVRPLDAVQLVHAGLDLVQRVVVHLNLAHDGHFLFVLVASVEVEDNEDLDIPVAVLHRLEKAHAFTTEGRLLFADQNLKANRDRAASHTSSGSAKPFFTRQTRSPNCRASGPASQHATSESLAGPPGTTKAARTGSMMLAVSGQVPRGCGGAYSASFSRMRPTSLTGAEWTWTSPNSPSANWHSTSTSDALDEDRPALLEELLLLALGTRWKELIGMDCFSFPIKLSGNIDALASFQQGEPLDAMSWNRRS